MTLPMIILCAGGHAKVLIDALLARDAKIAGVIDRDARAYGRSLLGFKVIGDEAVIFEYPPASVLLVNGLGSVDSMAPRRALFEKFKQHGYNFASVVHPSAIVGREVTLGEGVQIMAGAVLQSGATIGDNSIVNTAAAVDHDCRIGAHTHLAPGVVLSGGVRVGNEVHMGTAAAVTQGVEIGAMAFVAAGAVVTAAVLPGSRVGGVPAKVLAK